MHLTIKEALEGGWFYAIRAAPLLRRRHANVLKGINVDHGFRGDRSQDLRVYSFPFQVEPFKGIPYILLNSSTSAAVCHDYGPFVKRTRIHSFSGIREQESYSLTGTKSQGILVHPGLNKKAKHASFT
jgi:hypothetical protein